LHTELHWAPVENQARHDLYRLAQSVSSVTRAFHKLQKLHDPFFSFRTLHIEPIGEPPAGRRNIGKAEFTPLIEFPLNRKLRFLNPNSQI
jgi:hypothetical protein